MENCEHCNNLLAFANVGTVTFRVRYYILAKAKTETKQDATSEAIARDTLDRICNLRRSGLALLNLSEKLMWSVQQMRTQNTLQTDWKSEHVGIAELY